MATPITPLSTPPSTSDPANFDSEADTFLGELPVFADELNAFAASLNNLSTTTSSTSSVEIGTGTKNFTVETGKSLFAGMSYRIAYDANNWMNGEIISYDSGTGALSIDVDAARGSGTYAAWVGTLSFNGEIEEGQLAEQVFNDLPIATPALNDSFVGADESDSGNKKKYLISALLSLFGAAVERPVPVRQTVLSGPVDSNGYSSFGGSTGSATVTASATLTATAANGTTNRTGSITNPSWTGLSTNGTMYLYLDIAADGACTPGAGTLAPTYRWGGADVTTNNQFTFNIQEMTGKVGNGTTADQTYRVYVGEVTVASNVVSAISWYALMGRYDSGFTATLPGGSTKTSKNHLLGVTPEITDFIVENTTAEFNYAIGDRIHQAGLTGSDGEVRPCAVGSNRTSVWQTTTSTAFFITLNATTGAVAVLTAANWKYKFIARRGW